MEKQEIIFHGFVRQIGSSSSDEALSSSSPSSAGIVGWRISTDFSTNGISTSDRLLNSPVGVTVKVTERHEDC